MKAHWTSRLAGLFLLANFWVTGASGQDMPPKAAQRNFQVPSPNGTRSDPYFWLRDDQRKDQDVLAYLNAENAYFEHQTQRYAALTESLFQEIKGRIKQDDSTVPYKKGNFLYAVRYTKGGEYPVYVRKPVKGGAEQVMLDVNLEAHGHNYYSVAATEVSPNEQLLAYLEDTNGRRQHVLRVRNLKTGKMLPDAVSGLSATLAWGNDNRSIFYLENDPVTLLSTRVKRHILGTDSSSDKVVYDEGDKSFYLYLRKTGDDRYVEIVQESTDTDGVNVIDAEKPDSAPLALTPRTPKLKYRADHIDGRWIIRTDWDAPNYRLMTVGDRDIGDRLRWRNLIDHDPAVFIEHFELFKSYLAINERVDGVRRIRVMPWGKPERATVIKSDEPVYTETFDVNAEQSSNELRYRYTSLTTPTRVYKVNMVNGARTLLKEDPVLGGFQQKNYVTERVWATARDGVKVPVSLLYRKGFARDGKAPLYQYAYGSYGRSSDPVFRSSILSLVDRGFVYAIAHVRGGQEMGRQWYDDGHLMHKMNSFTDFIDVTADLVAKGYAAPDKVFAMGGSAGGLLMGGVANLGGDKYRGIVAHVPFVDVVTTMLDESIPLTTNEFNEWGNPKQKVAYDYILGYSPYDNVKAKSYPAMLVTTGLYDSQVQYFEPAKWVAKLRATKTDDHPLYFKINMEAGHGGKSGRFQRQREIAEEYAFILNLIGVKS